jgi:acyl-CoA synthetase (AMP-forming)/AMP-acid ligase II
MLLEMALSHDPARRAVGNREKTLTYTELYDSAGSGARVLREQAYTGVAYVGTNSPAFAVTVFAAAWAGIPVSPINYRLSVDQILSQLDGDERILIVTDENLAEKLAPARHTVVTTDVWLAQTGGERLSEEWSGDPENIAVLLHTSGTTAKPKAAILRHRHLVSYVFGSVELGSAKDTDAVAVTVPPYHVAGITNLLSNIFAGRRIAYLDTFTPEAWLDTVRTERVTHAMLVPTMLARIVDALEGKPSDLATLRTLSYGGSRIAAATVLKALELFPETDFVNAYGLTETSSTIALLGPEDHRLARHSDDDTVRARLGSAGRLIPGIEAEIRAEDGTVVPDGTVGELWLRGDQISGEYLRRESPLDAHGWFPTRDRAYFDRERFLFIEGRADDTIIRGGENIAPAEIEEALMLHPAVADAGVVGAPDEEWGQTIVAFVVPRDGAHFAEDELKSFVRNKLRTSKTPDRIIECGTLPYTETGKLLRRVLASRVAAGQ